MSTDPMEEASEVWRELRDALQDAGVHLPSLSVDPPTLPGSAYGIQLGRVGISAARKLTEVVKKHGGPGAAGPPVEEAQEAE
ncbi:hypothetical protein [Streptomyces sp. NPDC059009]|uniref:hypothetical protein n=1 Tax=Streptomyces sp. NPDC059009 TaxID=3346694 RepID=UPI0036983055